jgi:hypothetical protein
VSAGKLQNLALENQGAGSGKNLSVRICRRNVEAGFPAYFLKAHYMASADPGRMPTKTACARTTMFFYVSAGHQATPCLCEINAYFAPLFHLIWLLIYQRKAAALCILSHCVSLIPHEAISL